MKIVYGNDLKGRENLINEISSQCGILKETARILIRRNIDTVEKVKGFFSPSVSNLIDPFLLSGMREAVKRIGQAKENNETVLIFGDYDADGICATTVLYKCLKDFGITAKYVIPEREQGYGLNFDIIEKIREEGKISLIITVDCGISDYETIELIKRTGTDVIVTDHHEIPPIIPNTIVINPKLEGQSYGFSGLCGAGVAYKLGYAIIGEKANEYLDYVALATVADSMDLVSENRDIVYEGLKLCNGNKQREEFRLLIGNNGKTVTAQTLAFTIAPRINAGGRMGDAMTPLKLFLGTSEKFELAVRLNEYNMTRQAECERMYEQAKNYIIQNQEYFNDIILVADETWKAGFIGIVSARLTDEFCRPVIVFGGNDGALKGSARSVENVNIFEVISSAKDLLITYGGHSQAAGLSIAKENFTKLKERLNSYIKENGIKIDKEKTVYCEEQIYGKISERFAREIEKMEPFGVGNKRPLFTVCGKEITSKPLKTGSPHYSFIAEGLEMLDFNGEKDVSVLALPIDKKLVFELNVSEFKGTTYVKGYLKNVVCGYKELEECKDFIFEREINRIPHDYDNVLKYGYTEKDCGYGTLYVITDIKNVKKAIENRDLPITFFKPENRDFSDCIVISPNELPEGYDRVVYLDTPMSYISAKNVRVDDNAPIGYGVLDKISTNREIFKNAFITIKSLVGKSFEYFFELSERAENDIDKEQFIFCISVFFELGIFKKEAGVLRLDGDVKSELTNSRIYNRITELKNYGRT